MSRRVTSSRNRVASSPRERTAVCIINHYDNIVTCGRMVRKEILGTSERRILEAYLKGERLKNYTVLLHRIRKIGLKEIIQGCRRDLTLLEELWEIERARN